MQKHHSLKKKNAYVKRCAETIKIKNEEYNQKGQS